MNKKRKLALMAAMGATIVAAGCPALADPQFAVWLDGQTDGGGNGILTSLDQAFGVGDYSLVTTAELETPGYLDAYKAIIVSRYASDFGDTLSAAAAVNVSAYVGSGASQGGVAVFTNDAADDFYGSQTGDPEDPNLNQLFVNAATFAEQSGHGYVGEYNGAVMAFDSNTSVDQNSTPFVSLGLLQGSAGQLGPESGQFVYSVGPVGGGNPIDAGVTFPFNDPEDTTFLSIVTGANPNNVVDTFSDNLAGVPAIVANSYVISGGVPSASPEPSSWMLMIAGVAVAGGSLRLGRRRGWAQMNVA